MYSTERIALRQAEALAQHLKGCIMSSSLQPTLLMSCEMTDVLCDIERAGIKIDKRR